MCVSVSVRAYTSDQQQLVRALIFYHIVIPVYCVVSFSRSVFVTVCGLVSAGRNALWFCILMWQ